MNVEFHTPTSPIIDTRHFNAPRLSGDVDCAMYVKNNDSHTPHTYTHTYSHMRRLPTHIPVNVLQ